MDKKKSGNLIPSSTSDEMDSDLKNLLLDSLFAYKKGISKSVSPRINLDEQLNAYFVKEMTKKLSLSEVSTLRTATEIRQYGLNLAKSGDILNGEIFIDAARSMCLQAFLSQEALTISESFHDPAVAYIQYKKKEYFAAYESLLSSLRSCQILKDEYAYNVEARRIHLARNIIRVKSFSGSLDESMRLSSFMIKYIEGDNSFWPFPEQALLSRPNLIDTKIKWVLMDQILGEIALLLGEGKSVFKKLLNINEVYLFENDINLTNKLRQVHIWLAAIRAFIEDDVVEFLNNSIIFFLDCSNHMPYAREAIVMALKEVCKTVSPDNAITLNME